MRYWQRYKQFAGIVLLFLSLVFFMRWTLGTACLFRVFFGIPCPSCGMSRALTLFLHGNFSGSWQMHPLLFCLPILGICILQLYFWPKSKWTQISLILIRIIVVLFLLVYAWRMIFLYPEIPPMCPLS